MSISDIALKKDAETLYGGQNATPSPTSQPLATPPNQQQTQKLEQIRPIFRKTSSQNSYKLSQLPQLETRSISNDSNVQVPVNTEPQTQKRVINVNESLLHNTRNGVHKIPGTHSVPVTPQSILSPQVKSVNVPASILSSQSNLPSSTSTMQCPTPITPQLKSSTSTISFQVPNQKHRGSISARPSVTKFPSDASGSVQSSAMAGGQTPLAQRQTPNLHTSTGNPLSFMVNPITKQKIPATATSAANTSRMESVRSPIYSEGGCITPVGYISNNNVIPSSNTLIDQNSFGGSRHSMSPDEPAPMTPTLNLNNSSYPNSRKTSIPTDHHTPVYELKSGISSTSSVAGMVPTGNSTPGSSKKKTTKAIVSPPIGPVVPFTQYLSKEDDDKIHILIGATGSVATIKIPMIIDKLFKIYGTDKVSIQLVVTRSAEHFLRGLKISTEVKIWREQEEWSSPVNKIKPGDPILHVELRKWADIFLIAPLSANTLAKIANGLADNLLTTIVRIWNPLVPIIAAPAMNTFMYSHPMTKIHMNILKEDLPFVEILKPVEKVLVCGDIGMGGMREWSEVVHITVKKLKEIQKKKLSGEETMVGVSKNPVNGEGISYKEKGEAKEEEDDEEEDDEDDEEEEEEDDEEEDDEEDEEDDEEEDDEEEEEEEEDEVSEAGDDAAKR